MGPNRALKRVRGASSMNFWEPEEDNGVYLSIKLTSGKSLKNRGWPYIQQCVRAILGQNEKLAKANFQRDGSLLVKTKDEKQTSQLLKATAFGQENCIIEKDNRLNTSKGTVHAFDLMELSEEEIAKWFEGFGVVGVKRFTRTNNGRTENTPTLLLTFDRPVCPTRLDFDYTVYHVRKYIPNPLICYRCGKFGHGEARCPLQPEQAVCLNCGADKHAGTCQPKCISCSSNDHSCRSRECPVWQKEQEICTLKVEKDISYTQARKEYDQSHHTPRSSPVTRSYASVVRSSNEPMANELVTDLQNRVEKLERKMDRIIALLEQNTQSTLSVNNIPPQSQGSHEPEQNMTQMTQNPDLEAMEDETEMDRTNTSTIPTPKDGQSHSGSAHNFKAAKISSDLTTAGTTNKETHPTTKEQEHRQVTSSPTPSPQIGGRRARTDQSSERKMPSLTRGCYASQPHTP